MDTKGLEKALKTGKYYATEAQLVCSNLGEWSGFKKFDVNEVAPVSYDIDRHRLEAFLHFLQTISHFCEHWAALLLNYLSAEKSPEKGDKQNEPMEVLAEANQLISNLFSPMPGPDPEPALANLVNNFKRDFRTILESESSEGRSTTDLDEIEAELDAAMSRLLDTLRTSVVITFLKTEKPERRKLSMEKEELQIFKRRSTLVEAQINLYFSEGIMFEAAARIEGRLAESFASTYKDESIGELIDEVIKSRKTISTSTIVTLEKRMSKRLEELRNSISDEGRKKIAEYFHSMIQGRNDSLECRKNLENLKR